MEIIRAGEIMASHPEHQRLPHEPAYAAGSAFVADHFCPVTEAAVPIVDCGFMHADALRSAEEVFMTTTAGSVMPVRSVDGALVGGRDGPGEISTRLHNLYWEKRWSGWDATPVNYTLAS